MNNSTLSVITANYNHAHYLKDLINSILTQSKNPEEYIIVDDGSTDNSIETIGNFSKAHSIIKLLKNKKNKGVICSIKKALDYCSGDYYLGLSADDKILPGFIKKCMEMLIKYPQSGMCQTDTVTEWEAKKKTAIHLRGLGNKKRYFSPEELIKIMRKRILYPSGFGTIFRRNVFEEVGLLPELKWSSDRIYSIIIALRHGICYVPEPLAYQRRRVESYSEKGMKNRKEHRQVIKNILELLKKPQNSDVLPKIKKSCALASLGMPMLRVLFFSPKHRDYLSFNLMRLIVWDEFKNVVGAYTPVVIKKIYRSLAKNR